MRLGDSGAPEDRALSERSKPTLLLLVGAEPFDASAHQRGGHAQQHTEAVVNPRNLFDDRGEGSVVERHPAPLFGDRAPEEAQFGHLLEYLDRDVLVAVVVAHAWGYLARCEIANERD